MNRDVVFRRAPRRVVSLVPADTYTLFALGAGDRVVGRTRECVEPRGKVEHIAVCGGPRDIDVDAVAALSPDLVLCNRLDNEVPAVETLIGRDHPVLVSDPRRMTEGVMHMARLVHLLELGGDSAVRDLMRLGHSVVATAAIRKYFGTGRDVYRTVHDIPRVRVFMPIQMEPLMTVRGDTHASDALVVAGGENVFASGSGEDGAGAELGRDADAGASADEEEEDPRYLRVTLDEVVERAPQVILLPDEPYTFLDADLTVFSDLPVPAAWNGAIGTFFANEVTWYGAWSIYAAPRVRDWILDLGSRRG